MEIKHNCNNNREDGTFEALDGEAQMGHIEYIMSGENEITIEHTEVDPAFGGMGVGKNLVLAAVEYARKNSLKVVPECTYAKAVIQKDESLHDVLA